MEVIDIGSRERRIVEPDEYRDGKEVLEAALKLDLRSRVFVFNWLKHNLDAIAEQQKKQQEERQNDAWKKEMQKVRAGDKIFFQVGENKLTLPTDTVKFSAVTIAAIVFTLGIHFFATSLTPKPAAERASVPASATK